MTQEVFLRLWNQPDRFDPGRGTLRSFLLAQSHARAVDAIRSLKHAWRPVGSGVMPKNEVDFLVDYLFDGPAGHAVAERIDRRVDRLPGQGELHLLETAVTRSSRQSTAA